MTTLSFAVTWDYRCPFARNAHEHLITAVEGGAPWDVTFVPFSLNQVHVEEGGLNAWDDPSAAPSLLAMQAGISVRDLFPEQFLGAHAAIFRARHDDARDVREPDVLRSVLEEAGVDAAAVFDHIDSGQALAAFQKEHEAAANEHRVWGVPTFIANGQAVFVRLMDRPAGDVNLATRTIERVVELVGGWPELNEFKHTSIPR